MLLEGILGGVLGAVTRLAPEVLKFFDKKNEREHEIRMMNVELEHTKLRGEFRVEEKYVDASISQLEALSEAYKQQAVAESRASTWVSNISALVRPSITYTVFGLYVMFKVAMIFSGLSTGQPWLVVFGAWTEADMAMLAMILNFWFVSRSLQRYRNN